jgi:hypothetical protein
VWKNSQLNSEKIWKIRQKIVKWYGKYRRKVSWIVKRYGKYRSKVSWIVIRFGKYGRNLSWIVKRFEKYGRKYHWNNSPQIDMRIQHDL